MCDAACQGTQGFHLLRLAELGFKLSVLGDVTDNGDDAPVIKCGERHFLGKLSSIVSLSDHLAAPFPFVTEPGQDLRLKPLQLAAGVEDPPALSQEPVGAVASVHLQVSGIYVCNLAVPVHDSHTVDRGGYSLRPPVQLLFRAPSLRDVPDYHAGLLVTVDVREDRRCDLGRELLAVGADHRDLGPAGTCDGALLQ